MATLSTTAWVLHDLGLAVGFGGNLFGQLALHPALRSIESQSQRGKVTHLAWDRYKTVNAIALAAMGGTWLVGRTMISGWSAGHGTHKLTLLKDRLVVATFVTGVGALVGGALLDAADRSNGASAEQGVRATKGGLRRSPRLKYVVSVVGVVNTALQAGVLAVTAMLAMQSGKSKKWSFASRLLP